MGGGGGGGGGGGARGSKIVYMEFGRVENKCIAALGGDLKKKYIHKLHL
jgi:hypothetical protein